MDTLAQINWEPRGICQKKHDGENNNYIQTTDSGEIKEESRIG